MLYLLRWWRVAHVFLEQPPTPLMGSFSPLKDRTGITHIALTCSVAQRSVWAREQLKLLFPSWRVLFDCFVVAYLCPMSVAGVPGVPRAVQSQDISWLFRRRV
eukprot:11044117-Alexandrium_andersonii.AAC.1